ncbi:MAG: lytic transglycosylase domain-containing protein [Ornithinimicrobium sp.]
MPNDTRPENVFTDTTPADSSADSVSFDRAQSGRHRGTAFAKHPATMVTAVIAAGSVALAGYAAYGSSQGWEAEQLRASIDQSAPMVADSVMAGVQNGQPLAGVVADSARVDDAVLSVASVQSSQEAGAAGAKVAAQQAEKIAAEKKAEAEAKAAAEAQAKAEARAEAQAAAKAQEQAEAEAAARADREQQSQAASRSQERAESASEPSSAAAPKPAATPKPEAKPEAAAQPEPKPEPAPAPVSSGNPRSIARSMLSSYGWGADQFSCLDSLWAKESGWNVTIANSSSGAYGIPQALPGSKMASAGADWRTNPATQIKWGLGYIDGRYGSPCGAWSHSQANNWY